jgi:hypothetical protein
MPSHAPLLATIRLQCSTLTTEVPLVAHAASSHCCIAVIACSKHVPLKSVAAAWPAVDAAPAARESRLQQPGNAAYTAVQLQLEEVLQRHQQQHQLREQAEPDQQLLIEAEAAAASWWQLQHPSSSGSQCSAEEVHELLLQEQQGDSLAGSLPEQLAEQQAGIKLGVLPGNISQFEQVWQLPQWQVVHCSATHADQLGRSTRVVDAAASVEPSLCSSSTSNATSSGPASIGTSNGRSSSSRSIGSNVQQHNKQPKHTAAAPQPEPLYRLAAAAKQQQHLDQRELQQLLQRLQPLLPQLAFEHLAHAAWAAAQLAEQEQPSQAWLSTLLEAAYNCFQGTSDSNSSSSNSFMTPASTATLLQALVKLQQQPSQGWLSACCNSMQLHQWTCPRALSTVAACLPQLGHVPDACWAERFFAASAAALPAFPAISLARMLHGATAWRHLQQQQQQDGVEVDSSSLHWAPLQSWLLAVLASLNQHSSQLKPAELAMVLQAMQRLQQSGRQLLLPAVGQQPPTQLQQLGQQLLHSLMAAVLQQLPGFQGKDLTVMLFAVAALHEQQGPQQQQQQQQAAQQGVTWLWLQRVLKAVQVRQ